MSLTPTIFKELGFKAPSFNLFDVTTNQHKTFQELAGKKGTVVMFICNHCPFVVHVQHELVRLANDFRDKGIGFIAINSNDPVQYPEDSPENMKKNAELYKYPFSYLFDETQEVARDYDAACTPDFSIFDASHACVYRGQLDDSRPGNGVPLTGEDIRKICNALVNGEQINSEGHKPSIGCNIKWK